MAAEARNPVEPVVLQETENPVDERGETGGLRRARNKASVAGTNSARTDVSS